jgi:hypothetical protein
MAGDSGANYTPAAIAKMDGAFLSMSGLETRLATENTDAEVRSKESDHGFVRD